MGTYLSVLVIPLFNKLIELNREINGRWISYFIVLRELFGRRKLIKNNRIVTHDVFKDNIRDVGILPFPHEWNYDCPDQTKNENLLIYGVNSSKQSIKIEIKFRFNSDVNQNNGRNQNKSSISLRFDDNNGNYYTLEEKTEVNQKDKVYRISGLTIEILAPFKRKRISFRGYLTKNGSQLVYVKFRFIWAALSRVYDFTHDFDDYFIAKETTRSKTRPKFGVFEDRLEQFGQFKGTFTEDNSDERILYFWGSIAKKYLELKPINRRIIRVVGYNKQGIGFHLGFFLMNGTEFEYRFGFLFDKNNGFKKLKKISLQKSDFEHLLSDCPNISFKGEFGNNEYKFEIKKNEKSSANDLVVNGTPGMCYIFEEKETEFQEIIKSIGKPVRDPSLILGLNEENAKFFDLSGGKGSSLAVLKSLGKQLAEENYKNQFNVADGIVVTTNAYHRLLKESEDIKKEIKELGEATDVSKEELKTKCQNLVNFVSNHRLPEIIAKEIEEKLKQNFDNFENKLFAVRSSGASEDSEEMSAAGQMTTYLGVKGLKNIKQSVMKCWSSQFSHIAVEYKRGYGQPINSPMAVVIQEMVDCESAGVMFTCDTITGDERLIEITGNYGLAESVVSSSSEPDIIRLSVNIESNSLSKQRTVNRIESKVIGAKKTLIKLLENGGTVEEEVSDKEKCCISDEDLFRLGDLGLRIQKHYGNPRDIEWGIKGGQIFMLQSRPVTNLDNYTEYELAHEMDSPHPTEFEIYSRAHWNENNPGSSTWTVYTWIEANKSGFARMEARNGSANHEDYNPYVSRWGVVYNQLMFNMRYMGAGFFTDYPVSSKTKQMSMFGHLINDQDVINLAKETNKNLYKKPSIFKRFKMKYLAYKTVINGPINLHKTINEYMDQIKYDMVDRIKDKKTSKDILLAITEEYEKVCTVKAKNHVPCSMGASVRLTLLRNILEGAQENNPHLEEDMNFLISSCNDLISAEVPNNLRDIAKDIEDKKQFTQLSDKEAIKALREGTDEASQKFKQFLQRHGHRGYREFDPLHLPWADDPTPCIKTIKGLLTRNESQLVPKVNKTVDEVISELKTPLSFIRKLIIRKLLPFSRSGIGYRELSKHFMIWMINKERQAFRFLAKRMVAEGLIPDIETYFFLTSEEVERLCNGDRDPLINTRARLRKRIYPKMDKYKFTEFSKGPEMKPRNFENQLVSTNLSNGSFKVQLKGTPISVGAVKARVCVSEDITEADSIQSGDILITYSTDIGWSPYFPLVSGIVTEMNGTTSHGTVIAREYGIPSLIAVEGACRAFKTGDICVLDTKSATITKVG